MSGRPPGYVVVEGPIGVGKTTLARRLARTWDAELVLEAPEENPFLPRFYENPRRYALPAQLFFLLQRARQVERLSEPDLFGGPRVGDFLLEKDRLFAELNLEADELRLYDEVYGQIMETPPRPDLIIYLQAPAHVLRDRIARRGMPYERRLEPRYLQAVTEAYTHFFHHYDASPLLIVNASDVDLAHNDEDYRALLAQLATIGKGRYFFNPLPF